MLGSFIQYKSNLLGRLWPPSWFWTTLWDSSIKSSQGVDNQSKKFLRLLWPLSLIRKTSSINLYTLQIRYTLIHKIMRLYLGLMRVVFIGNSSTCLWRENGLSRNSFCTYVNPVHVRALYSRHAYTFPNSKL